MNSASPAESLRRQVVAARSLGGVDFLVRPHDILAVVVVRPYIFHDSPGADRVFGAKVPSLFLEAHGFGQRL